MSPNPHGYKQMQLPVPQPEMRQEAPQSPRPAHLSMGNTGRFNEVIRRMATLKKVIRRLRMLEAKKLRLLRRLALMNSKELKQQLRRKNCPPLKTLQL